MLNQIIVWLFSICIQNTVNCKCVLCTPGTLLVALVLCTHRQVFFVFFCRFTVYYNSFQHTVSCERALFTCWQSLFFLSLQVYCVLYCCWGNICFAQPRIPNESIMKNIPQTKYSTKNWDLKGESHKFFIMHSYLMLVYLGVNSHIYIHTHSYKSSHALPLAIRFVIGSLC